jgi:2-dehydro-3-deoxygluconokinase
VNRRLAALVDVMFGNEEDFTAALGFEVKGMSHNLTEFEVEGFKQMMQSVVQEFPISTIATTLRKAKTASRNDWGAICFHEGQFYEATNRPDLDIYDRVGGGDSFASGFIYGLLAGRPADWAIQCGAAHGALAMTTPGDTSMVTLKEILNVMEGAGARISR